MPGNNDDPSFGLDDFLDFSETGAEGLFDQPAPPLEEKPRKDLSHLIPVGIIGVIILFALVVFSTTGGPPDESPFKQPPGATDPGSPVAPSTSTTAPPPKPTVPPPTAPPLTAPVPPPSGPQVLESKQIAKLARPSIVMVEAVMGVDPTTGKTKVGSGTGFIYDKSGLLLTNQHVVGDLEFVSITFPDNNETYQGKVLAADERLDLAVVKVSAKRRFKPLTLMVDPPMEIGDRVVVMGYPLGRKLGTELTITSGEISSIRKNKGEDWYQVSASVNPGNSGGPCFDSFGQVVGVVTSKIMGAESIGFVRPIKYTKSIRRDAER